MKEKIYTIPVTEAYESGCECPLCFLERKLEEEGCSYALGAAMMEPDYREKSNESGFCAHHFSMLFKNPNKLSLALVLDTHLDEVRKGLLKNKKEIAAMAKEKPSLFRRNGTQHTAEELSQTLKHLEKSCVVCDKINYTMERYIDVLLYLWKTEPTFREKFDSSKGVCMRHFAALIDASGTLGNDAAAFISALYEKQNAELERLQEDIHKFTLKFDYRNKDMEWGNAKDAPIRTIERLAGYIEHEE